MVVGHPGEPGAVALRRVAVDGKIDTGLVPILVHKRVARFAKDALQIHSHAIQTVVQVRSPSYLKHKFVS